MGEWHYKSKRKPSGGILKTLKRADKKLAQKGGIFAETTIAKDEKGILIDQVRGLGGKKRQAVQKIFCANVFDGKKAFKAKILGVVENSANRLYTRRNIITKGAFIKVQLEGSEKTAKVTSRPGQSGAVNAIVTAEPVKPKKVAKEPIQVQKPEKLVGEREKKTKTLQEAQKQAESLENATEAQKNASKNQKAAEK